MVSVKNLWLFYDECVDPLIANLEELLDPPDSVKAMLLDLRFLKMLLFGMASYNEEVWHVVLSKMMLGLGKEELQFSILHEAEPSEEKLRNLQNTIQKFKERAKQICLLVLRGTFKCEPRQRKDDSQSVVEYAEETASLMNLILENLGALDLNKGLIASVKQQVGFIEEKVKLFEKFACVIARQDSPTTASQLIAHLQTWVYHISCFTCLYWIEDLDESFASEMGNMLSDLMRKYMQYTPTVVSMYLGAFMGSEHHGVMPQLIVSYVDFLLEHLDSLTKDDMDNLRVQLIFLLLYVLELPRNPKGIELIMPELYAIFNEVPAVICINETDLLSSFLHNMDQVKESLREQYVLTPLSSQYNAPKTNAIGFLDSLLANLQEMLKGKLEFIPLVKRQVEMVHEQLVLIRPFIQSNLEQLNEHQKLKDLWVQAVDVAYYAAYVTNLCPMTSRFLWYGMLCLPDVMQDLKLVISKARKKENSMISNQRLTREVESSFQATTAKDDKACFVGFEQDAEEILNQLVRGGKELRIISVSGMAGQGKTTLAKRIYNDSSIQYHFHKIAWYYVSKECNPRDLLTNIKCQVSDDSDDDVELEDLEIHDLSDVLRRSLKGKRYFIVLDDIWDVDVWQQVQISFPNDGTGSRILFTSRSHDVASQAKTKSISHPLRPFSDEQSWELMKDKISDCNGLTPALVEVGKQIAGQCKGLPLAVSVIAPLLKRGGEQELDSWKKVAQNMKLHLAGKGCMGIVELSYAYLPDHLKPCFLYFGAFPRGGNICARKLQLLWVAERFVKEDLAKEYLDNLVSRNLAAVTKTSSTGGIKSCNVHDLLYDLCIEKAMQDNFLHLAGTEIASGAPLRYNFLHRLCVNENGPFTVPENVTCTGEELQTSQVQTLLVSSHSLKYESFSRFLSSFNVLTVLDLDLVYISIDECESLGEIWSNIHLRYLASSGLIENVPASIVNMWSLETLIVRRGVHFLIPDSLWEMESLKYVDIDCLSFCMEGSWRNKSLMSMHATSNIEVLKGIDLEYSPETEKFLSRFPRLRKLKCLCPINYDGYHPMWFSMFGSLEKLESLKLKLRSGYQKCGIVYRDLPSVFTFPINLKKLTLVGFQLPWSDMSTIGRLPNLEVLKLREYACFGTVWHLGDEEFTKLRYLSLCSMQVEFIDDSACDDTPFPSLEKLFLIYCFVLKEIPSRFGESCTLDTIDITGSKEVSASVRGIVEQQRDLGNNSLQVFGLRDEETM